MHPICSWWPLCCHVWSSLRRDILLVHCLLVHHYTLSPTKDIKHHDASGFLGPNLQKLGGMCSCPTSGTPLSFTCLNQENKKCVRSGNLFNACSYVKTLVLMKSKVFAKLIQSKSSYVVDVQVVGMYLIVHYAWILRNMHCNTIVTIFPTTWTKNLTI